MTPYCGPLPPSAILTPVFIEKSSRAKGQTLPSPRPSLSFLPSSLPVIWETENFAWIPAAVGGLWPPSPSPSLSSLPLWMQCPVGGCPLPVVCLPGLRGHLLPLRSREFFCDSDSVDNARISTPSESGWKAGWTRGLAGKKTQVFFFWKKKIH